MNGQRFAHRQDSGKNLKILTNIITLLGQNYTTKQQNAPTLSKVTIRMNSTLFFLFFFYRTGKYFSRALVFDFIYQYIHTLKLNFIKFAKFSHWIIWQTRDVNFKIRETIAPCITFSPSKNENTIFKYVYWPIEKVNYTPLILMCEIHIDLGKTKAFLRWTSLTSLIDIRYVLIKDFRLHTRFIKSLFLRAVYRHRWFRLFWLFDVEPCVYFAELGASINSQPAQLFPFKTDF